MLSDNPDITRQFICVKLESSTHGDKLCFMSVEKQIPIFKSHLSHMNLLYDDALGGIPFSEVRPFAPTAPFLLFPGYLSSTGP